MSEEEAHAWLEEVLANPVAPKRSRTKAQVATASV
jgi:hypothetical protein